MKETPMRMFSALMILALATVSLSACNTVKGVGKDVEKVGQSIQK